MVLLIGLGAWLVYARAPVPPNARDGAKLTQIRIGQEKAWLEYAPNAPEPEQFRVIHRKTGPGDAFSLDAAQRVLGDELLDNVIHDEENALYRLFNVTSPGGVIWVALGFGAQIIFSARFLIQWIVSERRKQSVVPEIFWWISLVGGISLFCYFVWRQDIVGVFGQSSGVVIYARNIRLIKKQKHREHERQLAQNAE
ncbi:MAG: lipid-A-disaccharide synthase N-terminal domain-containing protein [Phycisphaeraceae bacterium]|nr:lipid-A-disaccharide synthase N-terminal domain-containing protein [Phycisphaeraceae bacterium]